jgi:hypothetical protein
LGQPAQLEYSLVRAQPKDSAVPNAKQVLTWAARAIVVNQAAVFWTRVKDPAGNWSSWVKVG